MARRAWLILAAAFVVWLTALSVDVSVFSEAEARRYSRGHGGHRGSIRHRRGGGLRSTKRNRKGARKFKGRGKRGHYGGSVKRKSRYRGSGKKRGVRRHKSGGRKRRR